MKILFVNQSDLSGGAARAAHRLASRLLEMNCDLKMIVMRKIANNSWVVGPSGFFHELVARILPRIDLLIQRAIGVKRMNFWSLNLFPNFNLSTNFFNSFDVIHFHWIGKNMIPLRWIRTLKKPIVWTLHDSWAYTGGCHLPLNCERFKASCGSCPQLNSNKNHDVSNRLWNEKFMAYKDCKLFLVAPSHWMAEQAKLSSLLKNFSVTVIPNGIDTNFFKPLNKRRCRSELGLPDDRNIILFGAMYADTDENKGMDLLVSSLKILVKADKNFTCKNILVIFGNVNKSLSDKFPLPTISMGMITNDAKLVSLYSAADVTVMPSKVESFGQVALESISCGTPVVGFNNSGLKDVLTHMESGYLANAFDTKDFADGISLIVSNPKVRQNMSALARRYSLEKFDLNITAKMYLSLFESLSFDAAKN